jgi:hypothetical protein
MPAPGPNGGRYEVHSSVATAKKLRLLFREASPQGRRKAFLAAFREVAQRLIHDPRGFGEPLYRLSNLRLQVYTAVVSPLVVHFAVFEDKPVVFLKGVELLPEEGREEGSGA